MMEHVDGVRVYWDGKQLHVKDLGISLDIPTGSAFPTLPFEGELWYVTVAYIVSK
jgi:hypothetical protein